MKPVLREQQTGPIKCLCCCFSMKTTVPADTSGVEHMLFVLLQPPWGGGCVCAWVCVEMCAIYADASRKARPMTPLFANCHRRREQKRSQQIKYKTQQEKIDHILPGCTRDA